MRLFDMTPSTPVGGDCTCGYSIHLKKKCTVREIIDDILSSKPTEWGYIKIAVNGKSVKSLSYSAAVISSGMDDVKEYLDRNVVKMYASGGWTRMDYIINI